MKVALISIGAFLAGVVGGTRFPLWTRYELHVVPEWGRVVRYDRKLQWVQTRRIPMKHDSEVVVLGSFPSDLEEAESRAPKKPEEVPLQRAETMRMMMRFYRDRGMSESEIAERLEAHGLDPESWLALFPKGPSESPPPK